VTHEIRHVDPADDVLVHEWFAARDTAYRYDQGDDEPRWLEIELVTQLRRDADHRRVALVACDEGRVVGTGRAEMPRRDNISTASLEVTTLPDHRRRGVGSALLDALVGLVREQGRTTLLGEVSRRIDGPARSDAAFAAARGFTERLVEVRRDLALPVDDALLDELEQSTLAASAGYRLVSWVGYPPEELLDARAELAKRISTDAPMGELNWEEEDWDAGRVRRAYDEAAETQRVVWGTLAIAPDGSAAGVSELTASRLEPERAYQWDTIVERAHRGHRLGLRMKVANQRAFQAAWPAARRMHTWNAATNAHMIAINERMGYRPAGIEAEWARDE
jgi:GNAT superfamily N-acetyltransferase